MHCLDLASRQPVPDFFDLAKDFSLRPEVLCLIACNDLATQMPERLILTGLDPATAQALLSDCPNARITGEGVVIERRSEDVSPPLLRALPDFYPPPS